jgi:DNA-directed RNA polymerase subunit K/omega
VIVVADACYAGALTRGITLVESSRYPLARLAAKRTRTALTSGGFEPVVDGDGSGHSVFARAVLEVLRENESVLEGQQLYARIRRSVIVNSDQTPAYGDIRNAGHQGGDFLFVRQPAGAAPPGR